MEIQTFSPKVPKDNALYHCIVPLLQYKLTYQEVRRLYELHFPPIDNSNITELNIFQLAILLQFDSSLVKLIRDSSGKISKVRPILECTLVSIPEFQDVQLLCQENDLYFQVYSFSDEISDNFISLVQVYFVCFYEMEWVVVFRHDKECALYDPLNRRNTKCFVEEYFFQNGSTFLNIQEPRRCREDCTLQLVKSFTKKFIENYIKEMSFSKALEDSQMQQFDEDDAGLDLSNDNSKKDARFSTREGLNYLKGLEYLKTRNFAEIYADTVQNLDIVGILRKIVLIEKEMKIGLIGLDVPIKLSLLALLCGEHVLLLGPPGVAKSETAKRLLSIISDKNKSIFSFLMTNFTQPDELLGPISVNELKKDRFVRVTEQYLPEAYIAFLDEIFKTSASLVNSLLTIMFERKFDNGGQRYDINLRTVICASNERPRDSTYKPFYDRILFRSWINYLEDETQQSQLLQLKKMKKNESPMHQISLKELELLTNYASTHVQDKFNLFTEEYLIKFFKKLKEVDRFLTVSDRRKLQTKYALDMVALTRGNFSNYLCMSDLWVLKYCIPEEIANDDKRQIQAVENIVLWIVTEYLQKDPVHPIGTFLQNLAGHFWIQFNDKQHMLSKLNISYIPFDFTFEASHCNKSQNYITVTKRKATSSNAVEIDPQQQYEVEWDMDLTLRAGCFLDFVCFDAQGNEISSVQVNRKSNTFLTVQKYDSSTRVIDLEQPVDSNWGSVENDSALVFYTDSNFDQPPKQQLILNKYSTLKSTSSFEFNSPKTIQIRVSDPKIWKPILEVLQSGKTVFIGHHRANGELFFDIPKSKIIIEGVESNFFNPSTVTNQKTKLKLFKGTKYLKMRIHNHFNPSINIRKCIIKPLTSVSPCSMITIDSGIFVANVNQQNMMAEQLQSYPMKDQPKAKTSNEQPTDKNVGVDFEETLHARGFLLQHVDGDGSCMFHAICKNLNLDLFPHLPNDRTAAAKVLRDQVRQFYYEWNQKLQAKSKGIEVNESEIEKEFKTKCPIDGSDFQHKIQNIDNPFYWGSYDELIVIAMILDICITLLCPVRMYEIECFPLQNHNPVQSIYIVYNGKDHYDAAIKMNF